MANVVLLEQSERAPGPRTEQLYGYRYDLLILADPRLFLINVAAFVDCDGHIAIDKGGAGFQKVLGFSQKNGPFLNALAVRISRQIPGVKERQK